MVVENTTSNGTARSRHSREGLPTPLLAGRGRVASRHPDSFGKVKSWTESLCCQSRLLPAAEARAKAGRGVANLHHYDDAVYGVVDKALLLQSPDPRRDSGCLRGIGSSRTNGGVARHTHAARHTEQCTGRRALRASATLKSVWRRCGKVQTHIIFDLRRP